MAPHTEAGPEQALGSGGHAVILCSPGVLQRSRVTAPVLLPPPQWVRRPAAGCASTLPTAPAGQDWSLDEGGGCPQEVILQSHPSHPKNKPPLSTEEGLPLPGALPRDHSVQAGGCWKARWAAWDLSGGGGRSLALEEVRLGQARPQSPESQPLQPTLQKSRWRQPRDARATFSSRQSRLLGGPCASTVGPGQRCAPTRLSPLLVPFWLILGSH